MPPKSSPEPVPLITLDNNGKFRVHKEAIRIIEQLKNISVLAIAGVYR